MFSTKPKSACQPRRQNRTVTATEHHLRDVSETDPAAADQTARAPFVDKVTDMCQSMKRMGHLSKEIVDEEASKQRDASEKKTTMPRRALRRRSNSFDKLLRAFRLEEEIMKDDSDKEESQEFESVHVPPPNQDHRHHHAHPKTNPTTRPASPPYSNPFGGAAMFDKLNASSSSVESLSLQDLSIMAKMDVVQRDTAREIRSRLKQENKAAAQAAFSAYAAAHHSSSCAIESISLVEFDGLILPKSEVPTNVALEHRRRLRSYSPTQQKSYSAVSA
jgi:hypothetical protein